MNTKQNTGGWPILGECLKNLLSSTTWDLVKTELEQNTRPENLPANIDPRLFGYYRKGAGKETYGWQTILGFIDRVVVNPDTRPRVILNTQLLYDELISECNELSNAERARLKINGLHLKEISEHRPDRIVDLFSLSRGSKRAYAIWAAGGRKYDSDEESWIRQELKKLMMRPRKSRHLRSLRAPVSVG